MCYKKVKVQLICAQFFQICSKCSQPNWDLPSCDHFAMFSLCFILFLCTLNSLYSEKLSNLTFQLESGLKLWFPERSSITLSLLKYRLVLCFIFIQEKTAHIGQWSWQKLYTWIAQIVAFYQIIYSRALQWNQTTYKKLYSFFFYHYSQLHLSTQSKLKLLLQLWQTRLILNGHTV